MGKIPLLTTGALKMKKAAISRTYSELEAQEMAVIAGVCHRNYANPTAQHWFTKKERERESYRKKGRKIE